MSDYNLFKSHKTALDALFQDFDHYRNPTDGVWAQQRRRRLPVQLEPELTQYVKGIDVQSPLLERQLVMRKQILMLDNPKVDVQAKSKGERVKEEAESIRMYDAALIQELEERYDVSGVNSTGQIADGMVVWYVGHKMPPEPSEKWLEQRMAEKQQALLEKPINQQRREPTLEDLRDEWFSEYDEPTITLRQVPLGTLRWQPNNNPTVVLEESEVPFLEWREYTKQVGKQKKYLTLDEAGKVMFLGDTQMLDSPNVNQKKLKVCIHAYQIPGSRDEWKVCQYISADGQEAEKWQEYDSPFGNPYVFLASGAELPTETDPHLRFRPDADMYSLYVVGRDQNEWLTRLTALAFDHASNRSLYIPLYGIQGDVMQAWQGLIEGMGGRVEGAGAERRGVLPISEANPGEWRILPRLERIPSEIPEAMNLRIDQLERMMLSLETSRFLTGGATSEEITQGTASAIERQTEQSTLPFDNHLKKQKAFWVKLLGMVHRAIVFWDKGAPKGAQKKYMRLASGNEPVAKGKVEPGTEIYVDADMLKKKVDILIYLGNDTANERQTKDAIAKAKYDWGILTFTQLLEGLGFEDPEAQRDLLVEEHDLERGRELIAPHDDFEMLSIMSTLSAKDLVSMAPMMQPPQPMGSGGGGQTMPVPSQGVNTPAVRPSTPASAQGAPR